ncbi:UNVERIFIED_CONTAM: hypothetical protein FKN15_018546 [Acipenser sinensis]
MHSLMSLNKTFILQENLLLMQFYCNTARWQCRTACPQRIILSDPFSVTESDQSPSLLSARHKPHSLHR